jgi:two-component system invasion response regulator UvrY
VERKILVGDDHQIIRRALMTYFKGNLGCPGVREAANCSEIMQALALEEISHCVLDLRYPDGTLLEILPNIQVLYPDVRIAIFSMQPTEIYRNPLRRYGVEYYLSKSTVEEELLIQLGKFCNNEPVPMHFYQDVDNPFGDLSPRELEILHYLLEGKEPKEIAKILNLSRTAVYTFRERIFTKTETQNTQQLAEKAVLYNIA